MHFSGIKTIFTAGVIGMSLGTGAAKAAELVVFSTISAKEALIELVPEFEHASGHKINITYAGGSDLARRIQGGLQGDVFIGPEEFSDPLLNAGKLRQGSRTAFARSTTGLAVRAGTPKPDISTPEKLKGVLLAAKAVSYSAGASGMHFVKVIQQLGVEEAIVAKRVTPKPGELVGAVVARGDADIAVQQISELLPVPGIVILDPLPAQLQQTIVYGATAFAQSSQHEAAAALVKFLRSPPAHKVLREKGLDPA
jgi:molybdate transport system substrate-binding protein